MAFRRSFLAVCRVAVILQGVVQRDFSRSGGSVEKSVWSCVYESVREQ